MKKFLLIMLVLVALVGGGVFWAIKKYVNVDELQARVVAIVKEKTGRDIAFSKIRVMPMVNPTPYLMVKLQDVTFSNADWASEKTMATLGALEINVALKPLLDKKIEVTKFVLDQPVINLEVALDGKKNWEFPKAKEEPAKEGAPSQVDNAVEGLKKDLQFSFSQFELKKGQLNFVDRSARSGVMLDKIDLTATYPDLTSSIQLDGWFEYLGRRVSLFASLDKPLAFAKGEVSNGKVNIKSDGVMELSAEGKLATAGTMLAGKIGADLISLEKFVSWLTGGKEKPMPFDHVKFNSQAVLTPDALKLDGAKLVLDEVQANGDVSLGLSTPKPDFRARVSLNHLNLDRFTGGGKESSSSGAAAGGGADAGWSDAPIDFSGLKAVNADLVLQTKGFSLRGAEVGASTLTVQLKDANLHFKTSEATLFGGKFLSDLTVDASKKQPAMTFRFGMNDVEAKPVLTTFAKFDKLSGKADAAVQVASAGFSQRALISNLSGSGDFNFKNGSLKGIDFVNILTAIQSRLAEMGVGEGKTDFVDLGGTFKIESGVARNSDLKMRGPLVQATGAGAIDLPKKFINYRALPVLTASSGTDNAKGFQVPVDIKGPFSNIKVKPDYKAVVANLLENPEDIQKTVKNVKEEGKTFLKDIKKDPNAALENLLGGGLFGKKKKAPPVEVSPEGIPMDAPPPDGGTGETAPAP